MTTAYVLANPVEDPKWRVVPDPHEPRCFWRCRLFQFEFCWVEASGMKPFEGRWYLREHFMPGSSEDSVVRATPERNEMWEALFVSP